MRHRKTKNKFGRRTIPRKSLMRSLAVSLVKHGKIKTTQAKAKAVRPFVEKLITLAKDEKLANRRILLSKLNDEVAVRKILTNYGKKYKKRPGGYLRISKLGKRQGDGAETAIIEFID